MNKLYLLLLPLFFTACKDRYNPPAVSVNASYLVVEGYLNGSGVTTIKLSRTFKLADTAKVTTEQNALVKVESSAGLSATLVPKGNGVYEAAQLMMNPADQYRVHIVTSGNQEYLSDFVAYKATPLVDSVSWIRNSQGVQLYVSTHDDQNKTIYYRWDYDETWEINSAYSSLYEYKNHAIVLRNTSLNIFYCWTTQSSTRILLGSSAKLQKDQISMSPVTLIPEKSWMLGVKYSINMKQYALPEKAYQYWQTMQKNTENLGSIFDPLPSEITGNIHAVANPKEQVIGYISAGTIQNKRIFISRYEVSNWGYNDGCELFITPATKDSLEKNFASGYFAPVGDALTPQGQLAYSYSYTGCIDCRLRGTNVKPAFWP